jgi:hypothetical protein
MARRGTVECATDPTLRRRQVDAFCSRLDRCLTETHTKLAKHDATLATALILVPDLRPFPTEVV